MRLAFGSSFGLEHGSWLETLREILEGMLAGSARAFYIMMAWWYSHVLRPIAQLVGIPIPVYEHPKIVNGTIKVAGVGYSRTGTYSLGLALEELGFRAFHTIHKYAIENEDISRMWAETIVNPALEAKLPQILGKPDLQLIADSNFTALVDLPSSLFFEQLLQEYPDCKFVLTTRDNSETWFRSWNSLSESSVIPMYLGGLLFPTVRKYSNYMRWIYGFVNQDASYLTSTFPKTDSIRENAIDSYERHNQRVREVIPPQKLLEYNVRDGWEPLCQFLEISNCPTKPFPKSNSARSMRTQATVAFTAASLVILYALVRIHKSLQRATTKANTSTKKIQ